MKRCALFVLVSLSCLGCTSKYVRRGQFHRAPGFEESVARVTDPEHARMKAGLDAAIDAVKGMVRGMHDSQEQRLTTLNEKIDYWQKVLLSIAAVGGVGSGVLEKLRNGKTNGGNTT